MDEDTDGKDDTKRKSRNLSEKKRRDQFNLLINELSSMVSPNNRKMDKSTVLKSTISFLKSHTELAVKSRAHEIQEDWKPSFLSNEEFTHLILEALDGFILVFSASGKIFYSSDSIISLLGYKPNDLLNMSLYDMVFEDDQTDLYNLMLNPKNEAGLINYNGSNGKSSTKDNQISFSCHVRRGGLDGTYELVHFVGYFRDDIDTFDSDNINSNCISGSTNEADCLVFVGTGHLDQPQLLREITVVDSIKSEFTSKHSLEWKFLFLDHRAPPIIGYLPFEVLGTSGYDYYHIDDLEKVVTCHEALMQKGEGTSCYYRFLTKGQQWIWLQTRFYITYHQWNSKPEFIVCTNKVVNYMNILKQMDSRGDFDENLEDNEVFMQEQNNKSLPPVSSPWSSKSSVGKASRLALTGVSSPTPSMSVLSSGTRGRGPRMSGGRPDSDSNSLSADSFTSKQSFLRSTPHFHTRHQYLSTSQPTNAEEQHEVGSLQPGKELKTGCSQRTTHLSVDVSNGLLSANAVPNQSMGHQPMIDANTPQHFMTAIPVQPVLAAGGFPPTAASLAQTELLHQPMVMTPAQNQLHEQLQRKHEELQQLIFQQQQELRLVSDQLLMARYGLLPAPLLSVPVSYSVPNHLSNAVSGNTSLKPTQTPPASIPLPRSSSSDLFVSPHHSTLVHSPIAVTPPVVVDPQQVNLQASLHAHAGVEDVMHYQIPQQQVQIPRTDVMACNTRPVGVASTTMYPTQYPSSPGVLDTLVVANNSPLSVPESTLAPPGTLGKVPVPQYYLVYGRPENATVTKPEMLLMTRDESFDVSSEPQSISSARASDGTQSTLLSQISDESDQSGRRIQNSVSRVSTQSDDTEQTRWSFDAYRETKNKEGNETKFNPLVALDENDNLSSLAGAPFPPIIPSGVPKSSLQCEEELLKSETEENDYKKLCLPTESRGEGDSVTPPSKILESCSSREQSNGHSPDLFSIPLAELLPPKDDGWPPPDQSLPTVDDFTGIE